LCLEYIAGLDGVKETLSKVSEVVKFFRSHSRLEQEFIRHAGKKLRLPVSTRFKTSFIMASCAVQHIDSMGKCLYSQPFKDLLKSPASKHDTANKAARVKQMVTDEVMWDEVKAIISFAEPLCELLDFTNSKACSRPLIW
jgi:hypothetical protein